MALDYAALAQAQVQSDPYPHFVVPKLMTDDDIMAAIADYPQIDMAGVFPLDTIEGGPAFQRLVQEIQGPELRRIIGEKFQMDLSDHDTMVTIRACSSHRRQDLHRCDLQKGHLVAVPERHSMAPCRRSFAGPAVG